LVKSTREQISSLVTETVNNPAFNDRKQNVLEITQKLKETGIEHTTAWFNWSLELYSKITAYFYSYLGKNQIEGESFKSRESQQTLVSEQFPTDLNSQFNQEYSLSEEDDEQDKIDFNSSQFLNELDMEEETIVPQDNSRNDEQS